MCMNHIEVLMEYKYMQKSLTQALTTLSVSTYQDLDGDNTENESEYLPVVQTNNFLKCRACTVPSGKCNSC